MANDISPSAYHRSSSGGMLSNYRRNSPTGSSGRGRPSPPGGGVSMGRGGVAGGAISPVSSVASGFGGYRPSLGGQSGATSPVSSMNNSPAGSPFRRVDAARRSQTPSPRVHGSQGIERSSRCSRSPRRVSTASGLMGGGVSGGQGRVTPTGVVGGGGTQTRSGRSESVPARPRSWTGPRSASEALAAVAAAAAEANEGGRSSADGQPQTLGILLPLDYSG